MKTKILSRVHFCENCYKQGHPYDGQFFVVHGYTTDTFWIRMFEASTKREERKPAGFTPHLFTIDKVLASGNFQVRISCGMEGCDTYIKVDRAIGKFEYMFTNERFITLSPKEWEALEKFTDSGYKL